MKNYASGVLLTAAVTWMAYLLADSPLFKQFNLSPIILAILTGMLIKNFLGVRRVMRPGVKFCAKKVLRLAIILLGFKLSLAEVGALGLHATLLIVCISTVTLLGAYWMGRRLGISKNLSLLIASGTSICGASAVIAVDAVTKDENDADVAFAIGVVTIFGTLFMLVYPLVFKLAAMSVPVYALWSGLSIHEVAQVVAAGFAVSPEAGAMATVVKLTRVLYIIPVTLFLSVWAAKKAGGRKFSFKNITVPWFVLMFFGVIVINSLQIIPARPTAWLVSLDNVLMTGAMAALGLETSIGAMKKVGLKPIYLGTAASVFISLLSLALVYAF